MAEKKFRLDSFAEGDTTYIEIAGPLDETSVFGDIRSDGTVKIDLLGVTRINSVGTRNWCLWLQRFRAPTQIVLINCPVVMVRNFSAISGFLTKLCRVSSFSVPFYSDATGERKDFLAEWGKHFGASGDIKLPQFKDSAGNLMDLDVGDSYFNFLRPRKGN